MRGDLKSRGLHDIEQGVGGFRCLAAVCSDSVPGVDGHRVVVVDGGHNGLDELEEDEQRLVDPRFLPASRQVLQNYFHRIRVLMSIFIV